MPVRDKTIGERVARARQQAELTPSQLARLIGVKPQALYMLEAGKVNAPTPENLFKIADALGVSPRMLVFGDHAPGVPHRVEQPEGRYTVDQVFDEETLLFARRFQALDEAQRRSWMLSLLLTAPPARPRTIDLPPPQAKKKP